MAVYWVREIINYIKKNLKKINLKEIDLIVVNFYPFEEVLNKKNVHSKIIENIDVGGPSMVRAAAKNYNFVTVVTNPNQYSRLIEELKKITVKQL